MNPDKTFFTADTHFGHKAMLRFGRPFASVEDMNEALIGAWNQTVPKDGYVYHLGDVAFMKTDAAVALLARLNGRIRLVPGNHDKGLTGRSLARFEWVEPYQEIQIEDHKLVLCHYALESWNKMHYGSWHLHGHSHGNLRRLGRRLDVGVDCSQDFAPMSYRRIEAYMASVVIESRDHHQPK